MRKMKKLTLSEEKGIFQKIMSFCKAENTVKNNEEVMNFTEYKRILLSEFRANTKKYKLYSGGEGHCYTVDIVKADNEWLLERLYFIDKKAAEFQMKIFEYEEKDRNIVIQHIAEVEKKWKPCDYCEGERKLYQETRYEKLFIDSFGKHKGLSTEFGKCPPYTNCCRKDMVIGSMFIIKYCPECGRPLTKEAWEEWKKRMRG